ncbi:MAG: dTDP-4-dehydrorhamnose 3,5-epimerase family protein [candidate division WOR-3 bacterium]|nr:MAG: dTDP-4-dehydrorhamnose 3,5-epimerase family protein [candidate division WOR-3 bacterium]
MANDKLIHGVSIKNLKLIPDERGRLMEIFRADDKEFAKFGQVYVTTAYPGVVKAWHSHKIQDDNMTVLHGMAKIVLYDDRDDSPTRGIINEFFVGEHNHILLHIPKHVWHGFKCVSDCEAMIINTVTECYDYSNPDEYRKPAHGSDIPYDWSRKDG